MTDWSALTGDFLHQLLHVGDAARRLLAMQDSDPLSPSHGSFHYAYWRDKTSEFGDARFQEAGAALGLLAHPAFREIGRERSWPEPAELLAAFEAGLGNLKRLQYAEGSYDEWYKGERGFAATAFTTFAYAAAAIELGDVIPAKVRANVIATLAPAARWLLGREDLVKTNHEVVAAAALAAYSALSGDAQALAGARDKLARSVATQTSEGWFPELRGMDFGYSALVIDYLGHYGQFVGMDEVTGPSGRLMQFLLPHFHADMTLSAEGGTCRNPYAGQAGYVLLAPHVEAAASVAARLAELGPDASRKRAMAYLADDLRLARWSILPLLAALARLRAAGPEASGQLAVTQGWTLNETAGVAAFHAGELHVHVPYAGGAMTRIFHGDRLLLVDGGIDAELDGSCLTAMVYDAARKATVTPSGMAASFDLAPAGYFYPGFLQRLVLRLGSTTSWSSRRLREAIDWYRQRKRTAINQSATSVGKGSGLATLLRTIEIGTDRVTITDQIGPAGLRIRPRLEGAGLPDGANDEVAATAPVTIRKIVHLADGKIEIIRR